MTELGAFVLLVLICIGMVVGSIILSFLVWYYVFPYDVIWKPYPPKKKNK